MALIFTTHSEEETIALGEAIGRALWAGDVLAIEGELGAGKTRLVRGVCRGLGLDESLVSSPTFVVVNHYPARASHDPGLYHVDAYRLHGADELEAVGWDRVMDGTSVVAIEWASRLGEPREWVWGRAGGRPSVCTIGIRHEGSGEERRVLVDAPASWGARGEWGAVRALAERGAASSACPGCGGVVAADGPHAPFCSERCKMADLGKWLSGAYVVSRELTEDDVKETGREQ